MRHQLIASELNWNIPLISPLGYSLFVALAILVMSCAESIKHDENLAAKRAIDFARVVLIGKNFDKGYEMLAAGGKRHISLEKFKETVSRLHPRGFPIKVTAMEFQPMPGEKAIWIYLVGQNAQEQFYYRVTMDGTGGGDYKVLTIDTGVVGRFFSPSSKKQPFPKPISTPP